MNRLLVSFVLVSTAAMSGPVAAQSDSESRSIEEIVVTATKRGEQNLQDVPMSITAFSEEQLEIVGADDLLDYLTMVPGLSFRLSSATGSRDDIRGGRRLNLRGIESGPDGIPTTAFYLDDAPIPVMDPKLFDISRVEVLRGPQGTLFGANSMGGTVRLVTNKPKIDQFEYKVDTTFAFMNEGEESIYLNGMLNVPLVDGKAALRAVVFHRTEGGFIDIVEEPESAVPAVGRTRTAEDVNDEEVNGARIALTWQPVDNLTITPSVFYQKIEVDDTPNYEPSVGDLLYFDKRVAEVQQNEFTLSNVEISYDFGNMELFSSTAFSDSKLFTVDDFGKFLETFALPPDPFQRGFQDISTERFSQEIRLSSSAGEKFNWIVGFFYMDEDRLFLQDLPNDGLQWCTVALCGADLLPTDTLFTGVQMNNDERTALFGEITYSPNRAWEITAGVRWFDNEQTQVIEFDGFFNGGFSRTEGVSSATELSPKVQVGFHLNDNTMVYGLATKGFRPGGPTNLVPAAACAADLAALGLSEPLSQFESDTLWNYEAGVKSSFADGRVTLNATAYFIDWTDVQQAVRLGCGFGFVGNVGAAESKGVEIDFAAQPTDNIGFYGSIGYTDAKFTETSAEVGVTAGDKITNTPEITAFLSAQYDFPVADGFQGYVQGSFRYTDDIIGDTFCCGTPIRPSYSTADLRIGVLRDDRWEVVLFVKNLTDERGLLTNRLFQPFALNHVAVIRPRTFGITLRFNGGD